MRGTRLTIAASALVLVATSRALAAQNFEGVSKFVIQHYGQDEPDSVTQFTKGSKMRLEFAGKPGALVYDGTKWFTLFTDVKRYVIIPIMDTADAGPELGRKNGRATSTGKTSVIAGIKCELWHFTGTGEDGAAEVGDACLARGAGFMVGRMSQDDMGRHANAAGLAYEKARASGMGVLGETIDGKVVLTTLKAQPAPQADALFAIPPGYKATTMKEIFKFKLKP
ncbi:MAG: DUF4412 domain-containing protein [Gemmatimonadota bacterium]